MEKTIYQENQNAIDKYLSREFQVIIKVIAGLGLLYTMVLVPLQRMQSDIDYIKTNHLAHIEQEITEIRADEKNHEIKDTERDIKLERILTILQQQEKEQVKK